MLPALEPGYTSVTMMLAAYLEEIGFSAAGEDSVQALLGTYQCLVFGLAPPLPKA